MMKKTKDKFLGFWFKETPMFETLLVRDKNKLLKLLSLLKKTKKTINKKKKYKARCKSSLKKLKFRFLIKIRL